MGLASDLSYEFPRANWFQRAVKAFASTRPGAWLFSKFLRHLDDLVQKLTRGRTSAPEVLAGLPVVDVTTTGRKSAQPRTSHLISIPIDDTLALIGTNFGQPTTPPGCSISRPTRRPRSATATRPSRSPRGPRRRPSSPRCWPARRRSTRVTRSTGSASATAGGANLVLEPARSCPAREVRHIVPHPEHAPRGVAEASWTSK